MAISTGKTVSSKTIHGKSIPGKSIPGKSIPGKSVSGKFVPAKSFPGKSIPKKTYPFESSHSPVKKSLNDSPSKSLLPSNSESVETYISLPSCSHLLKVLNSNSKDAVLKTYSAALKIVILRIQSIDNKNKNKKEYYYNKKGEKIDINLLQLVTTRILYCKDCKDQYSIINNNNIFMCLQCTFIGCSLHNHAKNHAKNQSHVFGINPYNGEFMCLKCGDLVFHPLLERIRYKAFNDAGTLKYIPVLPYFETDHNLNNHELILKSSRLPSYKELLGLRGFINLGSTCFMSSVLQTIIHNPFLKHYYLSGSHSDCKKINSDCLSCCVDNIYQDFFTNPAIISYGLTTFIQAAWKVKKSLAGYSEQDAHEFWQFLIHQIHKNDTKRNSKESTPGIDSNLFLSNSSDCNCIIHKTFSGSLQSTLKCTVCGFNRKTQDPMLDVSLEIQDKIDNEKVPLENLHDCFKKYTREEELDVLYDCSYCKKKTKVTKTLHLHKLPPVLSIQLKRFEHSAGISSKLDYHIDIPVILNIKNYVSSDAINKNNSTHYELFAIICHLGNVNTGHYLAYVKISNGFWFKFDDANITRVSESDVKKVNGYMLLYCINEFI